MHIIYYDKLYQILQIHNLYYYVQNIDAFKISVGFTIISVGFTFKIIYFI